MENSIPRIATSRESFTISSVSLLDADQLIREYDFPAILDNPLRLLMFPSSNPETSDKEIKWNIDGLKESLQSPEAIFRKVCTSDGIPIGFAGWTIDKGYKNNSEILAGNNLQYLFPGVLEAESRFVGIHFRLSERHWDLLTGIGEITKSL